ncbi:MAG: T9SS type A sorting domain-containing protein [Flavobacteriales bacterium]|nr:T9SS type A sorting domain-containing protein [Flavobacteriales bacterium]
MKHKKIITSVVFLLLSLGGLHAQENTTAAGGEATGSGGTASYSVGQVVYTTVTGTNGSVAQGVQQPYEISITTGVAETSIKLEMNVYPNPTTNYLQLKVESEAIENLSFQLVDLQGKVIENKEVMESNTTINMEALPKAIYFLNVTRNNQTVKKFKVIKQ